MRIKIRLKMIVDILLFLSGLVCMGTGLALLILPSGPGTQAVLKASSSVFDLFTRSGLKLFHNWSSILIIAFILFHLMLNWRMILCYFKNAFKPVKC